MIVDPNLLLQAVIKTCDVILAIHADIPPEERRKHHERMGRIWDVLWKQLEKADVTP